MSCSGSARRWSFSCSTVGGSAGGGAWGRGASAGADADAETGAAEDEDAGSGGGGAGSGAWGRGASAGGGCGAGAVRNARSSRFSSPVCQKPAGRTRVRTVGAAVGGRPASSTRCRLPASREECGGVGVVGVSVAVVVVGRPSCVCVSCDDELGHGFWRSRFASGPCTSAGGAAPGVSLDTADAVARSFVCTVGLSAGRGATPFLSFARSDAARDAPKRSCVPTAAWRAASISFARTRATSPMPR